MDDTHTQVISRPHSQPNGKPLVYDCFMFFNELDILEMRMHTLAPVVDRFILVESDVTNTGKPKELYFMSNKSRFAQFEDKIIHLVYRPSIGETVKSTYLKWYLENKQRDAIMAGLTDCRHDDIILISDVDEISDSNIVRANKRRPGIKVFQQSLIYICVIHRHRFN